MHTRCKPPPRSQRLPHRVSAVSPHWYTERSGVDQRSASAGVAALQHDVCGASLRQPSALTRLCDAAQEIDAADQATAVSTCDAFPVVSATDYTLGGKIVDPAGLSCPGQFIRVWTAVDSCGATAVVNQSISTTSYVAGASTCASTWPSAIAVNSAAALVVHDPCLLYGMSWAALQSASFVCRFAPSTHWSPAVLLLLANETVYDPFNVVHVTYLVSVSCAAPAILSPFTYYVELSVDGGVIYQVNPPTRSTSSLTVRAAPNDVLLSARLVSGNASSRYAPGNVVQYTWNIGSSLPASGLWYATLILQVTYHSYASTLRNTISSPLIASSPVTSPVMLTANIDQLPSVWANQSTVVYVVPDLSAIASAQLSIDPDTIVWYLMTVQLTPYNLSAVGDSLARLSDDGTGSSSGRRLLVYIDPGKVKLAAQLVSLALKAADAFGLSQHLGLPTDLAEHLDIAIQIADNTLDSGPVDSSGDLAEMYEAAQGTSEASVEAAQDFAEGLSESEGISGSSQLVTVDAAETAAETASAAAAESSTAAGLSAFEAEYANFMADALGTSVEEYLSAPELGQMAAVGGEIAEAGEASFAAASLVAAPLIGAVLLGAGAGAVLASELVCGTWNAYACVCSTHPSWCGTPQQPPNPSSTTPSGQTYGDPWLVSFDGLCGGAQAVGQYKLLQDSVSGLLVQIEFQPSGNIDLSPFSPATRAAPYGSGGVTTLTKGIAIQVMPGCSVLQVQGHPGSVDTVTGAFIDVYIDGAKLGLPYSPQVQPASLNSYQTDCASLYRTANNALHIDTVTGYSLSVKSTHAGGWPDVGRTQAILITPPRKAFNRTSGLLGSWNNNATDDLVDNAGIDWSAVYPHSPLSAQWAFVQSHTVQPADSLFFPVDDTYLTAVPARTQSLVSCEWVNVTGVLCPRASPATL